MFSPKPSPSSSRIAQFSRPGSSTKRVSNIFTPRTKRQSSIDNRSLGRNRSLQSSILEETTQHTIENFGLSLPVLVTEALTLADRNTCVSVRIDSSGWAWLVGGRKLFLWRYKQAPYIRYQQCHELLLPPSDLAHNADRVCVICDSDTHLVSCVAVSPEGFVRYWPNVTHESLSVEISAQLGGEESATLLGFHNTISCRSLKAGHGMFAGLGRRMSSFLFGSGQNQTVDAPLQRLLAAEQCGEERMFYMLSGGCLQKWGMTKDKDRIISQTDLKRLFKDAFASNIWEQESSHLTQLKVWILDIQITNEGVQVLGAATNPEVSPSFYYALAYINMDTIEAAISLKYFMLLDYAETYQEEEETRLLGYKLLVPQPNIHTAYLHHDTQVLIVSTEPGAGPLKVDKAEFRSPGEALLGAGSCNGVAVFFSSSHGLVSITSALQQKHASILDETVNDASLMDTVGINASLSQARKLSISPDKSERFKAAFLLSFSGEMEQVGEIMDELLPDLESSRVSIPELDQLVVKLSTDVIDDYPSADPRWAEVLHMIHQEQVGEIMEELLPDLESSRVSIPELDQLVVKLSTDVIDDYPSADPRWAESHYTKSDSTSSTSSLIIVQQLKDKQKAHSHVINFLKKTRIWDKLTNAPTHEGLRCTKKLLCEHVEKIVAACALRELHANYSDIVDTAILSVLEQRHEVVDQSLALTPQDLFYRSVSQVHEIFTALLQYEEKCISQGVISTDLVTLISGVNTLMENMLQDALEYRKSQQDIYDDVPLPSEYYREFIPWTSSEATHGTRSVLRKQFQLTVEHAIPKAKNIETRGELFQQILSEADVILSGHLEQIASVGEYSEERRRELTTKYETERQRLVSPFMHHKQYERAASLAEKYCDFTSLIAICDVTNNEERLQRYQEQFSNKGFSEELFNWFLKEGKRNKLLSHSGDNLKQFLAQERNKSLRWLDDIHTHDFANAHTTLLDMAMAEEQYLFKRKTLFSLSKLAALACDDSTEDLESNISVINEEQHLISHQEDLPAKVIEECGLDSTNMRVLAAHEIIELIIGETNVAATEYDFKKALDLLVYISEPENVESVRLRIWCKAILRDNWADTTTNDPQEVNRHMIFFKIIDIAFAEGIDLHTFLPDVESILSCDLLGNLQHNKNFEFLIRAGYEQIRETIS